MLDFFNDDIFNIECDMVVVPISTVGTISDAFKNSFERLKIQFILKSQYYKLGEIELQEFPQNSSFKFIAFVCTVEEYSSSYYAIQMIGRSLGEKLQNIDDVKEIATPILGTGAGKLDPYQSRNILFSAFYETAPNSSRLTFCTPDKNIYQSFEGLSFDTETPSGQLVIEAELPRISETDFIEKLQYEKEFYYDLAVQKFHEYLNYKSRDTNFYLRIEEDFKSSGLTFKDFLPQKEQFKEQYLFLSLCGELIAYIDYHAYRKNIWNKYPDKRVLANSAVRQNNWILNLIKYKRTENIKSLSSSIRNSFQYLQEPVYSLTMLSDKHRERVFNQILLQKYNGEEAVYKLLDLFKKLGFKTNNSENFGALCSRILYLPYIKPIWLNTFSNFDNDKIVDEGIEDVDIFQASMLIDESLRNKSKRLDLGNCGLQNLTVIPELFECKDLEELILSNEWAEYENGKWRKHTSKNKGKKNTILFLPDEIKNLKNLKRLVCGGDWNNQKNKWNRWSISSISHLIELKKLEYLNVSNNRLKSIKGLNQLTELKTVHLNNNEISSVEVLTNLQDLHEIYLSNNLIKSVSFLQYLSTVQTIDLHNNSIKDLRPLEAVIDRIGIENDKWKVGTLNIAKNPLEQPPIEIVNIGKEAVLRTFKDVKQRGRYINKDIKVILVGNSEVGKSTLVKYLDNENRLNDPHPATLWMEEKTVKSKYKIDALGEVCILHIFDFGGHDYYHDTHHLFYSSNTIYILLWDEQTNNLNLRTCIQENRSGEKIEIETQDYPIKYWLDSVKHYIKDIEADNFEFDIDRDDTYNSSLILIQNKVESASHIFHLNNEHICENYTFIYDIINISIKDPRRNLLHFDEVFQEMLNSMRILGAILPKFYETIKNNISTYAGLPVLTTSGFMNYCNDLLNKPIDSEQCQILIKYLEQIGLILYSAKTHKGKVYIDKNWIIENIHKVLTNLVTRRGEFDKKYMVDILGIINQDADNILEIMSDFKMIFKHPYSETFIAPLYLPKMPEGKIKLFLNDKVIPYRRFEYSGFIHKNVVLSVFQKYSSLIPWNKSSDKDMFYYWKDGLIIKKPQTPEIVMIKFHLGYNDGNACIDIFDITNNSEVFINEVIDYIREVNKGYEIEEMVTLDGIEFISTEILENNAKHGKLIFTERKQIDANTKTDRDKYFKLKDYKMFLKEDIKRKKVVISYSKKDIAHVHTLKRYLQPLVDAELIDEPWYCTSLLPGDDWNLKIKAKFDEADIVLFMVSEYFYSTKYIVDHEITNAINRYDLNQSIKIVPIILEFYEWGRKDPYNLQRFSALPYQAKPISDFSNPKLAWSTITTSVRMMIEKDLDPGKIEIISRDLQEIYERQVKGKLDNNS